MGKLLRRQKAKCWRSEKKRIVPIWVKIMVGMLLVSQIFAHIQYWKGKARFWEKKANEKPKTIEKEVIKYKEKIIEKKVYINRRGEDVTAIVEYSKKKFGSQAPMALAIFNAESGLYSKATHQNIDGSVDRGIAQINSCHCHWVDCSRLFDWKYNIDVAYKISSGGKNWNAWTTYKTGAYQKYLPLFY